MAVREGCTTFDVQAVAYDSVSKDSDTFACGSLRKVIIPESIEKVVDSRNLLSKTKRAEFKVKDIIVKSKNWMEIALPCYPHASIILKQKNLWKSFLIK